MFRVKRCVGKSMFMVLEVKRLIATREGKGNWVLTESEDVSVAMKVQEYTFSVSVELILGCEIVTLVFSSLVEGL